MWTRFTPAKHIHSPLLPLAVHTQLIKSRMSGDQLLGLGMVRNLGRAAMAHLRRDVCVGCQQSVGPLCSTCRRLLNMTQPTCVVGELPIAAAATYAPPISNAIIAFKDRGQWPLRHELSQLLARSLAHLYLSAETNPPLAMRPLVLVPIAASATAIRERDADVIAELAVGAARILNTVGLHVTVNQLLVLRRPHRDNVGLSRAQRMTNMADAFAVEAVPAIPANIVLVDDVVTTGSTLLAAHSALVTAGVQVVGAAVLAATKGRS